MLEYQLSLLITTGLGLVGLTMGSFAGAMVWRLRASQLRDEYAVGEEVTAKDSNEVHAIKETSISKDRSVCLHCGHTLEWYDLLPIISWL